MASADKPASAARRIHATAHHLQPAALGNATAYPTTHDKIEEVKDTPYFVDNKFVASSTTQFIDLHDPATNNLVTRVPENTDEELKAAVASAEKAFKTWRTTSVLHRQAIMFRFVSLIRENWDRLAASITLEQGKTFADAKGDVLRGLQWPKPHAEPLSSSRAKFSKSPRTWRPEPTASPWASSPPSAPSTSPP